MDIALDNETGIAQTNPARAPATSATEPDTNFDLARFEAFAYAHQHEPAMQEFLKLLNMLDRNYGALDETFHASPTADGVGLDADAHIVHRICAALTTLFSDAEFFLTDAGARQFFRLHRWISTLFAASSFRNADHILRALNLNGPGKDCIQVRAEHLLKFCVLYTTNSEIPLDMDALWAFNRNLAASLACSLLSPRFLGTESAHHKREVLLPWLAAKLDEIHDLDLLPVPILHDVYMHCSYADTRARHAIKEPINRLVRRKLLQSGLKDVEGDAPARADGEKPVLLVVLEWFSGAHSIYRTHSASLRAAREHFRVIGVGLPKLVDDPGRGVFDEFLPVDGDMLAFVADAAHRIRPEMVYYPSFGMFPATIFLSNLRLAPVQVVSYGHPATSHSPFIDHFVLPQEWVGDPACFSESLLPLQASAMPFVPTAAATGITPALRNSPETLRIAIAGTPMKLNPAFLKALATIQQRAPRPVQFHFFTGLAHGLVHEEVRNFVHARLPDAVLHPGLAYSEYMARLNGCDMALNPFPFGNTNGVVDVSTIGLVGVCRSGPEVLEHIDGALFKRLGLPEWLVASSTEEYVSAALRLIQDDQTRLSLRRQLIEQRRVERLYAGEPGLFGQALIGLLPDSEVTPHTISTEKHG